MSAWDEEPLAWFYRTANGTTILLSLPTGVNPPLSERGWKPLYERPAATPIPMVLHCPKCGMQHIDAPDDRSPEGSPSADGQGWDGMTWRNPPHRSHLCHGCGHIWRPADVPTTGVAAVQTKGKADSPIAALAAPAQPSQPAGWIDEFGNVFPLAAHSIDGKPLAWRDAHKRGWSPLYRAPAGPARFEELKTSCDLGVGCDEAGVCYAKEAGHPEYCPKEKP